MHGHTLPHWPELHTQKRAAANWPLSATANGAQSRFYFICSFPLPSPPQQWQLLPNEPHSLPSRPCDNEALPRTTGNQGAMSTARSWPPERACFPSFTKRAKAAPHCLGGEWILASGNCPCPILTLSWNSAEASCAYICAYSWTCAWRQVKHVHTQCRRELQVIYPCHKIEDFNCGKSLFYYKFKHTGESADLTCIIFCTTYQQWINKTRVGRKEKNQRQKSSWNKTIHIVYTYRDLE